MRKWIVAWLDVHGGARRVAVLEGQKRALEGMLDKSTRECLQLKERMESGAIRSQREIAGLRARLLEPRPGQEQDEAAAVPGLTGAEIERLAMLVEECGEVQQAAAKVLRHGWESQSPFGGKPNRVSLERELGDLRAVVNLCADAGDVSQLKIGSWAAAKKHVLPRWTHHQAWAEDNHGPS